MSSRVNILVSFKIYSVTDTYYLVGASNTGSFNHELGKGWDSSGAPQLATSRITDAEIPGLEANGLTVTKIVPLGEKYGDYKMRMYAENELGIRSAYVELDKVIPAPDIDGTFRFNSITIEALKIRKPSAYSAVQKAPLRASATNKLANTLKAESEFLSQNAFVKWDLRAPYGFTGSPKGTVVNESNIDLFESLFKTFEVYLYKNEPEEEIWDGVSSNERVLDETGSIADKPGQIIDKTYDDRIKGWTNNGGDALISEDIFNFGITKELIENNVGEGERSIFLKVVGKDVYYTNVGDLTQNYLHRFVAVIKVENTRTELDRVYADLYGNQMTVSYINQDADFAGGKVVMHSFVSKIGSDPFDATEWTVDEARTLTSAGGSNVFEQDWSSPINRNYYKYIIEVHDSYGFCGFHSIDEYGNKAETFFTKNIADETTGYDSKEAALAAALADTYSWESERKIGTINIVEDGSSFDIGWDVVDSRGHVISPPAPNKDGAGKPIFTMGDRIEIEDLSGFTVHFECPSEYTNSSLPIRDAFDLGILGIQKDDGTSITYKDGSPTANNTTPTDTIPASDIFSAENDLSVNIDTSVTLNKKQNADLYRSWFNEHNLNIVKANSEFRKLYKARSTATIGNYNDEFYAVDAQRRIKISVSLIDSKGRIIDTKIAEAHNEPPRVLVQQGDGLSFASVKTTDLVEFKLSLSEKADKVDLLRRPFERADGVDQNYGMGQELNVDKTSTNNSLHIYNVKDPDFFAENDSPSTSKTSYEKMLSGYGVDYNRWKKIGEDVYITNAAYNVLADDVESMNAAGGTENKQQYVRIEVNGRDISNPKEGGFWVETVSARGNNPNSAAFHSPNLLSAGNIVGLSRNITIVDQPPLIRENGLLRQQAPGTQYDYMLLPYDTFGTGEAWRPERSNFYGGILFSQDENGAIGTIDLDAPFPPQNLKIDGANKTFFLEWDGPQFEAGDVDHYNLYYIKDTRSDADRNGLTAMAAPNAALNNSIANGDVLRFNKSLTDSIEYNHSNSEFHKMDLGFQQGGGSLSNVLEWSATDGSGNPKTYTHPHYVKARPRNDSSRSFRLYKTNANTTAADVPGESSKWEEQLNVQLWENGQVIHKEDLEFNTRTEKVVSDGSGGSQTYNLIFYVEHKTYSVNQIAFYNNKCYKCTAQSTTGSFTPADWQEIENVSIEEIKIPVTETSLTIVANTHDKGYFFFESVDRIGNRSKLHIDPTRPTTESNDYAHQLGKSELRDIGNFEQELSAEFPNAIMLRPSDPFTTAGNVISWDSHYLYNAGDGYFMPSGQMNLKDTYYIDNNSDEFIRHIYWNPSYGYNTNATSNKWTARAEHNLTISENQMPYKLKANQDVDAPKRISKVVYDRISTPEYIARPGVENVEPILTVNPGNNADYYTFQASMYEVVDAADYDKNNNINVEDSDSDTDINYKAYYSFSTGNPASQIYNRKTNGNQWLSDPNIASDIVENLNSTTTSVIHHTPEPAGFGEFGIHIDRSETIGTTISPTSSAETNSLILDGGFQICRIDNIGGTFSHTVNFEVFNNATIGQANISNATITNAQITDLKADKITAGVIGSHKIEIGSALIPGLDPDFALEDKQRDSVNGGPGGVDANGNPTNSPTNTAFTNSDYVYGAITSEGFGHKTQGVPGFFISGDGQFGFQTTNGGIYLRHALDDDRNAANTPTQLVIRGRLIQENSDPFIKMEMAASTQTLTFDEHAENHFYYDVSANSSDNAKVYGTETQIMQPSNGEVTISYSIQNAFHTDGSAYDINELELVMYVDGDPTKTVDQKDVFKLIKSADNFAGYAQRWVKETVWIAAGFDTTQIPASEIKFSDPNDPAYITIWVQESSIHGSCSIAGKTNKTACENAGGTWTTAGTSGFRDAAPNLGLVDTDDINRGGSITFDFVGGRLDHTANFGADPSMIFFTGQAITDTAASDDEFSQITDRIESENLEDTSESDTLQTIIPIADSVTIELRIVSRAPAWDNSQEYLFGELVSYNGETWRSNHSGQGNKNQTPSSSSAFWTQESGDVILEKKAITISRKDQPTNLFNIDLVSEGENIIRNHEGSVTIKPVLTFGTRKYDLDTDTGLEDWMKTVRSQLAIYQDFKNKSYTDKYKLHKDIGSDLTVVVGGDDIKEGKNTFFLVDLNAQTSFTDQITNLNNYNEVDTIDVLDVTDGVNAAVIEINKDNKFFTRELLIRPLLGGNVNYANNYKLEGISNKTFNANIVYTKQDKTVLTKSIVVKIASVGVGDYITRSDIQILDSSNTPLCSFTNNSPGTAPTMLPFVFADDSDQDYDNLYSPAQGHAFALKKSGVGRVYFTVDSLTHVTEIVLRFDFILQHGNSIAVIDDNNSVSSTKYHKDPLASASNWGDWSGTDQQFNFLPDMVKQVTAEENILINTSIPENPAFRLSMAKPFISFTRNAIEETGQNSNQTLLRRCENIVPLQIFMGQHNVSDEIDETGSNFDAAIVPNIGQVVSFKYLTEAVTKTKANTTGYKSSDAAYDAINALKLEQSTEGVFYESGVWKYNDGSGTSNVDGNFLFYIPPQISDLDGFGNSKIKIKATYKRLNMPVSFDGARATEVNANNKITEDVFEDIETLNVVEISNGESRPFVEQDNETVQVSVDGAGAAIAPVDGTAFHSTIRLRSETDNVALFSTTQKLLGEFSFDNTGNYIQFSGNKNINNGDHLKFNDVDLKGEDGNVIQINTQNSAGTSYMAVGAAGGTQNVRKIMVASEETTGLSPEITGQAKTGDTLIFLNANNIIVASCKMPKVFKRGIAIINNNALAGPSGFDTNFFNPRLIYEVRADDMYVDSDFLFAGKENVDVADSIMIDNSGPYFGEDKAASLVSTSTIKFYSTPKKWKTDQVVEIGISRSINALVQGKAGAVIVYRAGNWSASRQYSGTPERREVVKHNGEYWITSVNASTLAYSTGGSDTSFDALENGQNDGHKIDVLSRWRNALLQNGAGLSNADVIAKRLEPSESLLPNGAQYNVPPVWEPFGSKVESVATNLLFADDVRIQRGIVAGLEDITAGFFASQIDLTHLDADGNYSYNYAKRPREYKTKITLPTNPIIGSNGGAGSYGALEWSGPNGEIKSKLEYLALGAAERAEYGSQITGTATETANDIDVPIIENDSTYANGHPLNPYVNTSWKVPFTDIPGFFIGYHPMAFLDVTNQSDKNLQKDFSVNSNYEQTYFNHFPMMEFRSHNGNFIRWDGLRLEMYGSVINGSINPSNISVKLSSRDLMSVFADDTIYGGQIFCGGGFGNYIPDTIEALGSVISGGGNNRVFGQFNSIGGGYGNTIESQFSFIGSGYSNIIGNSNLKLLGHSLSGGWDVNKKLGAFNSSQQTEIIENIYLDTVGRGNPSSGEITYWKNEAQDWYISEIIGRFMRTDERLRMNDPPSVEVGYGSADGEKNAGVPVGNPFNAIVTGRANKIFDSKYSVIGSGFGNIINKSTYSTILNGQNNAITSADNGERFAFSTDPAGILETNTNTQAASVTSSSTIPDIQERQAKINAKGKWAGLNIFQNLSQHSTEENWYFVNGLNTYSKTKGTRIYELEENPDTAGVMIYQSQLKVGWFMFSTERRFEEWLAGGKSNTERFGRWAYIPENGGPYALFGNTQNGVAAGDDFDGNWYALKKGPSDILLFSTSDSILNSSNVFETDMEEVDWGVLPEHFITEYDSIGLESQLNTTTYPLPTTIPALENLTFIDYNGTLGSPGTCSVGNYVNRAHCEANNGVFTPDSLGHFGYNTIAGGQFNIVNRCINSALIGSSGTFISDLKNAVIGGMSNRAFGDPKKISPNDANSSRVEREATQLQKGVTIFGSENIYDVRDANLNFDNLTVSLVGSQNVIIGCRKSVVLGSGNQIKGTSSPGTDISTASAPSYYNVAGEEVNILGTNNKIQGEHLFARNLSIFGSNFVLTSQDQIVNAYYLGNPFPAGGLLTRLFVAADGGAYFTGDVVSFAMSDEKYKENIKVIDSPIEKIKGIRGIEFEWNKQQEMYKGKDVGVIAQEVEKVLPEIVETRKSGKAVKYEKLTPLLIEAVKSQQEQIEELKKTIEDLKLTINKLK